MFSGMDRRAFGLVGAALMAVLWLAEPAIAAQPKPPPNRLYVDEDYDFRLTPPPGWHRYNPMQISVPGEICRAWTPDGTATIVVFVQQPGAAVHPRELLASNAARWKQAGAVVKEQEVRTVAGMQGMSLGVEGDGTGAALTGDGPVRTYQHWIAVPRERDILVLLLTAPASDSATGEAAFKVMLDTLHLGGLQTAEQRQPEPPPLVAAPVNLDFEAPPGVHGLPGGWDRLGIAPASGGVGYEVTIDREVAHGGKASGRIGLLEDQLSTFGTLTQAISAEAFRGKRARLSGWLRTRDVTDGWAGLWLRVDSAEGTPLAFDNMEGRGVKGTTDWGRYEVVLDVPEQALRIAFGALVTEGWTAWVDDLAIEVVGKDVPTTQ